MGDHVDALLDQLAGAVRPPVKVRSRREDWALAATSRFRAAVDLACANGASLRSLARDAECTVRFLIDVYDGKRGVPAWLIESLPVAARAEIVRLEIEALRKVS